MTSTSSFFPEISRIFRRCSALSRSSVATSTANVDKKSLSRMTSERSLRYKHVECLNGKFSMRARKLGIVCSIYLFGSDSQTPGRTRLRLGRHSVLVTTRTRSRCAWRTPRGTCQCENVTCLINEETRRWSCRGKVEENFFRRCGELGASGFRTQAGANI